MPYIIADNARFSAERNCEAIHGGHTGGALAQALERTVDCEPTLMMIAPRTAAVVAIVPDGTVTVMCYNNLYAKLGFQSRFPDRHRAVGGGAFLGFS
jgi:hypothetical protein